ncbi:hypothetical protein BH09ACT8_BH09ACT8_32620 [soil metagenome]
MPVIRSKKWALMLIAPFEALVLCGVIAVSPATALAAQTALIIGATGVPDPAANPTYIPDTSRLYFPFTMCRDGQCQIVPITTPQELFPLVGTLTLDESVRQGFDIVDAAVADQLRSDPTGHLVIAGGSQGAIITALEKAELADQPDAPPADQVEFILFDNQTRPNGGLLSRLPAGVSIPGLGISAQPPAPTNTGYHTIDVAMQYDGYSDFPVYPINLLAVANAIAGTFYIHGTDIGNVSPIPTTRTGADGYSDEEFQQLLNDPVNRQTYGDTVYITIPTEALPILQPLRDLGAFTGTSAITTPLADLIEPALRVLIETGYDRSTPYGQPITFRLLPAINPLVLATDLINASAQGLHHALQDLGLPPAPTLGPTQPSPTSQTGATQPALTASLPQAQVETVPVADAARATMHRSDHETDATGVAQPATPATSATTPGPAEAAPSASAADTSDDTQSPEDPGGPAENTQNGNRSQGTTEPRGTHQSPRDSDGSSSSASASFSAITNGSRADGASRSKGVSGPGHQSTRISESADTQSPSASAAVATTAHDAEHSAAGSPPARQRRQPHTEHQRAQQP